MTIKHVDQKQLAERWGISPKTLERWRWLGEGPKFLKLGGRVVYRLEDIEAFEAAQMRTRTGERATLMAAESFAPKGNKRRNQGVTAVPWGSRDQSRGLAR